MVSYLQSPWRRLWGEDFSRSGLFWNMVAGKMGWGWVRKCDREENGAQMSPGCYCGQLQDHQKMCSSVIPLHSVGSQLLVYVSPRLVAASGECEFPYLTWEGAGGYETREWESAAGGMWRSGDVYGGSDRTKTSATDRNSVEGGLYLP